MASVVSEAIDEAKIREMVRRVVYRTVGRMPPAGKEGGRALITQAEVQEASPGEAIVLPQGALVTPLARQAAMERKVELVGSERASGRQAPARGSAGPAGRAQSHKIAIGADHGGYELKETLKEYLRELGHAIHDCGTESAESVDYPDYALAVAELVAQGHAWRGILVDGAGIGSCMAANKVPGVRAAMCYDEATALNSRAHNDANVLTLGAGLIGPERGRRIVRTWLEAESGGGRHARRVEKIMQIEQRFLKAR